MAKKTTWAGINCPNCNQRVPVKSGYRVWYHCYKCNHRWEVHQ